jgi:hypothetical protein
VADLTPLQRLLARATYEDQQARTTAQRLRQAKDTQRVLAGRQTAPQGPKAPASQVVVHLTLAEWQWLADAARERARQEGTGLPPRIASYLAWRTTDCLS